MKDKGIVIDNKNGFLKVKIIENSISSCDKCSIKGICNQKDEDRIISLPVKENIPEGTEVIIILNEINGIFLASIVFLFPLIIFILSNFILSKFFNKILVYLFSFLAVILYFGILKLTQNAIMSKNITIIKKS